VAQQHPQRGRACPAALQQEVHDEGHLLVHLHEVDTSLHPSSSCFVSQCGDEVGGGHPDLLILVLQEVEAGVDQPGEDNSRLEISRVTYGFVGVCVCVCLVAGFTWPS